MTKSKNKNINLFISATIVMIFALLSNIFENEWMYVFCSVMLITIGTMYIFKDVLTGSHFEIISVMLAYSIRIVLMISNIYFNDMLNIYKMGSNDSEGFFRVSQEYFIGNFAKDYTKYPYILNVFYHIFGPKRIVPQYINIFCWYLCWKLIHRILKGCNEKQRKMAILLFCFMPASIFMSSELLRESIMMLFMMFSFYFLWKWMDDGGVQNIINSFLLSLPAVFLHSVSVALWAGIAFVFLFWNYRLQKWCIAKGKVFLVLLGVIIIYVFFHYKIYALFSYFPKELSIEIITGKSFDKGRADYLVNVNVTNIPQFIFWTIIRGIYFWISPVIFDWQSIKDVIGVIADVVPLMYLLFITCKKSTHEYENKQYIAGIVILVLYTLIYAWGVRNAGGAMRHRNMLLGLIIMTYGIRHIKEDKLI